MKNGEFKNKCDECFRKRTARIYPIKLHGKWVWLCVSCWDEADDRIKKLRR